MAKRRWPVFVRAHALCALCRLNNLKRGRVADLLQDGLTRARVAVISHSKRAEVTRHCTAAALGLALDSVQHLLRLYVEALTGREVEVAPLAAVPDEARIDDGRTIHLPSLVNEFGDEDLDFRLYKVLAAHAAGQIEFGTYERGGILRVAHSAIAARYSEENVEALDAFALADEIVQLRKDGDKEAPKDTKELGDVGYRDVLRLFPMPQLARRVFGTLENGRIDRRLRRTYRGLNRDLDLIRQHLSRSRPRIMELPASLVPFELLFQITMLGGAREDARTALWSGRFRIGDDCQRLSCARTDYSRRHVDGHESRLRSLSNRHTR